MTEAIFVKNVPVSTNGFTNWVNTEMNRNEMELLLVTLRDSHIKLMKDCMKDAEEILNSRNVEIPDQAEYYTITSKIASALFEKRAFHILTEIEQALQAQARNRK